MTSLLVLDECVYSNHLQISCSICHRRWLTVWSGKFLTFFSCRLGAMIINGIRAVQRCVDAPLCLPPLPLTMLFAARFVHFSLSFRVVYQLVGLQPICLFLLSLSEGLRGQIPSCSLTGLRFWIGYLCNRFILWILSFYYCYTIQLCWTSNWRFHNILFPWDVRIVIFNFYQ